MRTTKPAGLRVAEHTTVAPSGCWEFTGYVAADGYPRIYARGRGASLAHRVAWEVAYGPIPEGLLVCHRCDNPVCVRPDHLFLGTAAENSRDMATKNRAARPAGERNPRARLTWAQVREIRAADGPSSRLAERYGVATTTVTDIRNGRRWKEAEE